MSRRHSKGWIPATFTVGQIDYGVELVSTGAKDAMFQLRDLSIVARQQSLDESHVHGLRLSS